MSGLDLLALLFFVIFLLKSLATFGSKKRALPTFILTMKNLVRKIHEILDTNPGFGQICPKKWAEKVIKKLCTFEKK